MFNNHIYYEIRSPMLCMGGGNAADIYRDNNGVEWGGK